jgi:Hydrazine synthase alpha subunit middle domain
MIKVPFFSKKNSLTFANFICLLFLLFVPLVSLAQDVLPDLIVVRLPADIAHSSPVSNNIDDCSINKIARVNGGLVLENLTPDFLSARDPSISFDGQTIFFVGKRSAASFYQVYKMSIDGTDIVQLSSEPVNHSNPLQVGDLFYLNDVAPTPQIIYGRQTYGPPAIYAFFASNFDGSEPRQITHNVFSDIEADVLPNGRLVFSSYSDKIHSNNPIAQLMAVSIDGTDLMPVTGDQLPAKHQRMPSVGFDDKIYFIESAATDQLVGGTIGVVSRFRSLHSYSQITVSGDFAFPCPLPDGTLLSSMKNEAGKFVLVQVDSIKGHKTLFEEKGYHIIDAQPIVKRKQARGRSSVVGFKYKDSGVFFCMNVYESDRQDIQALKPGSVKEVLITEGVRSGQNKNVPMIRVESFLGETDSNLYYYHRILGQAPVEKDGSFHIRVPSETPVTFHLLDDKGAILASQKSWTWVMQGESRGCIGCHEDRELSPPNVFVDAVKKLPVELVPIAEQRTPIDMGKIE